MNTFKNDIFLEDGAWTYVEDLDNAFFDADAIVILTEWNEYIDINWEIAAKRMRKPSWIFDSRSIIDPKKIQSYNLNFWRIGDGS